MYNEVVDPKNSWCFKKKYLYLLLIFVAVCLGVFFYIKINKTILSLHSITKTKAATKIPSDSTKTPPYIYGGATTTTDKWKFMVALIEMDKKLIPKKDDTFETRFIVPENIDNRFLCNATLIGKRVVLTAAHCLEDLDPKQIGVAFGFSNLEGKPNNTTTTVVPVESQIIHEEYETHNFSYYKEYKIPTSLYDIALLILSKDAPSYAKPISLNTNANLDKNLTPVIVIGYGENEAGQSDNLSATILLVIDKERIRKAYDIKGNDEYYNKIFAGCDLFAGFPKKDMGPCYGDSGGPIVAWNGKKWIQIGISSGGAKDEKNNRCSPKDFPSLYTKVRPHIDWIKQKTEVYIPFLKITVKLVAKESETFIGEKPIWQAYLQKLLGMFFTSPTPSPTQRKH